MGSSRKFVWLSLVVFLFSAVATNSPVVAEPTHSDPVQVAQAKSGGGNGDPLEPLNRAILEFNEFVQGILLRPIAGFTESCYLNFCETVFITRLTTSIRLSYWPMIFFKVNRPAPGQPHSGFS